MANRRHHHRHCLEYRLGTCTYPIPNCCRPPSMKNDTNKDCCNNNNNNRQSRIHPIVVEGHRGPRGLLPHPARVQQRQHLRLVAIPKAPRAATATMAMVAMRIHCLRQRFRTIFSNSLIHTTANDHANPTKAAVVVNDVPPIQSFMSTKRAATMTTTTTTTTMLVITTMNNPTFIAIKIERHAVWSDATRRI